MNDDDDDNLYINITFMMYISLLKNPPFDACMKLIKINHHLMQDKIEDAFIKVVHCIYKLMPFIMINTLLIDKHEHFLC